MRTLSKEVTFQHRRRLRGQPGHAPPIIELGAKVSFCPPKIQVRIFENIETTSETKTIKELNYYQKYHKENSYFNYLHPIIFKILKTSLGAKLTCELCT